MPSNDSTNTGSQTPQSQSQSQNEQLKELMHCIEIAIQHFLKMLMEELEHQRKLKDFVVLNDDYVWRDDEEEEYHRQFYFNFMFYAQGTSGDTSYEFQNEKFQEFQREYEQQQQNEYPEQQEAQHQNESEQSQGEEQQNESEQSQGEDHAAEQEQAQAKDHYETLGVDRNASKGEIRKAYLKQALENHPDKVDNTNPEAVKEATENFKAINTAYECLSDASKRAEYDNANPEAGTKSTYESPKPSPPSGGGGGGGGGGGSGGGGGGS